MFSGPLATFMDYITYGYMIDNIVLLITGWCCNVMQPKLKTNPGDVVIVKCAN